MTAGAVQRMAARSGGRAVAEFSFYVRWQKTKMAQVQKIRKLEASKQQLTNRRVTSRRVGAIGGLAYVSALSIETGPALQGPPKSDRPICM